MSIRSKVLNLLKRKRREIRKRAARRRALAYRRAGITAEFPVVKRRGHKRRGHDGTMFGPFRSRGT